MISFVYLLGQPKVCEAQKEILQMMVEKTTAQVSANFQNGLPLVSLVMDE